MADPTNWRSLVDGKRAEGASALLERVTAALIAAVRNPGANPGLFTGQSGLSIFFGYRGAQTGDQTCADLADALLQQSAAALTEGSVTDWDLSSGIAGIAWAWVHVRRILARELDPESTEDIDLALLARLGAPVWEDHFDLTYGLVGIGLYALELLPHSRGEELFARVVWHLERLSVAVPGGRSWPTAPKWRPRSREVPGTIVFDLGMAHGVPAVISLLAAGRRAGLPIPPGLLEQAMGWLWSQRLGSESTSLFGWWATLPAQRAWSPARSAWCYGDPAIALAFAIGGDLQAAAEISARAASRDPRDCGVDGLGLCHGQAGLALCHARLAHLLQSPDQRARAIEWFDAIVSLLTTRIEAFERGSAPELSRGFLFGLPGVALVLQAFLTDSAPEWDRVLGLSARGQE